MAQGSLPAGRPVRLDRNDTAGGMMIPMIGGLLLSFDVPLLRLSGADTWTIIVFRGLMLFAALATFWYFFRRRQNPSAPFINGTTGWVIANLSAIANIMFVMAIHLTSVANVVFILAFNPMFTAVLSWVVLGERLRLGTWLAILISLAGVAIIVHDGITVGTWPGDILAIGVSVLLAIGLTLVRRSGTDQSMSPALGALLAAVACSYMATPGSMTVAGWSWLAINGLFVTPLSSALMIIGPRYAPAAIVAMFYLVETVLTPVWMWLVFTEVPTTNSLVGGSIVVVTLVVHSLWRFFALERSVPRPRSAGPRPRRR